jgi:hypothetical protein
MVLIEGKTTEPEVEPKDPPLTCFLLRDIITRRIREDLMGREALDISTL